MRKFVIFTIAAVLFSAKVIAQQWGWATLIAPQNSTTVTLLDTNSTVIKTWTGLSGQTAYSSYMMPGGYIWRAVKTTNNNFNGGGLAGRIQKIDWNGTILFDYTISDANQITHHDYCPLKNGNVLLIVYDKKTAAQMTAAGATANSARQLEKIVELQPTGTTTANIVWQWNLYDHLVQNTNSAGANYQSSLVNNPQLVNVNYKVATDWIHMNGIDYNEALDQIIVSSHNMNEVWIIDHSTTTAQAATHTGGNAGKGGDLLYRWGSPTNYGATGSAVYNVVHDPHWVPANCPKAGYIAAFNNNGVSNSISAIDIFNPPLNGINYNLTLGSAYAPATYAYRHQCSGYSSNMGNSDQLPNGNMLVCLATAGKVYEIDSNGNNLWTYTTSGSIPQAHRYDRCYIENPLIAITNSNPTICSGSSLQLNTTTTATNVSSYTYQWSPATGLSSTTAANPTVSGISSPTTYTVIVNTGNCKDTATITLNINALPTANAGNDVTITQGNSTTLTATGGTSYSWSNGATTATTTVSPTTTTNYTVTVTNANGCTAIDQVTVNVTGGALSANIATSNTTICIGNTTQLTASGSGGSGNYTYSWSSTPAGFTSSSASISVSPTVVTTYTVTVSDGTTTATASLAVTVNNTPTAFAGNDVTIAAGNATTLTATGGGTYSWSNGANTATNIVSPASTTTYTVTVTNTDGCTASDAVVVTVSGGVFDVVLSLSDSVICNGDAAQLFAIASGGSGSYTYNWSSQPSGFSSTLYNPYINPAVTSMYTVTVNDGNTTVSKSILLTVNALPVAPVITATTTTLTSSATSGNQWFYYGNPINGETNQTYSPTITGAYQVQTVDANGCASPLSDPYQFTISGIKLISTATLKIYPNPASEFFYVDTELSDFSLSIFNQMGQTVRTCKNMHQINVADLANGIYTIKLESENEIYITKLIISK